MVQGGQSKRPAAALSRSAAGLVDSMNVLRSGAAMATLAGSMREATLRCNTRARFAPAGTQRSPRIRRRSAFFKPCRSDPGSARTSTARDHGNLYRPAYAADVAA
jgi:hypothetical protein